MSDHNTEESNNLMASFVGKIFLILVPISLIVMLGFVGAAFLQGGGYKEAPPEPIKPKLVAIDPLGKTTYATCSACHGADGKGLQVGPMKMAPSFEGSELLLGAPEASIAAVLKGIHKEPGSPYMGMMAALGAGMDDKAIAAVLTYTRNSFGNSASAITPEQVAEVRTKYAEVNQPMGLKRADLEKIAKGE